MIIDFTDSKNKRYQFKLKTESTGLYVEITVYRSPGGSSTTIRRVVNGRVEGWHPYDQRMVSVEAKYYLDKVIKNKAFL